jgi:L-aminopeptidase/D-esterase-like protein
MKGLTDIPGIRVGHASDYRAITGCTAILCEGGAIAGVSIGGSATGTEELDLLSPLHLTTHIHGICLAGGSAFGLEAVSGVRRYLEKREVGFRTSHARVPLVAGAILYDLRIGRSDIRPTREMGEAAAAAATTGQVAEGCVGAGTGAVIGGIRGIDHAMKGGLGSYTVELPGGVMVSALAAVNPFGDVVHPRTRTIIAGVRTAPDSREFANTSELVKAAAAPAPPAGHTTLVVVGTNAALTKVQATKLAQLAQHGMIQAIAPVHTTGDGDVVFTLSTGSEKANFTALGVAAAEAVAEAIVRAATTAWTLGGVPGLAPAPSAPGSGMQL